MHLIYSKPTVSPHISTIVPAEYPKNSVSKIRLIQNLGFDLPALRDGQRCQDPRTAIVLQLVSEKKAQQILQHCRSNLTVWAAFKAFANACEGDQAEASDHLQKLDHAIKIAAVHTARLNQLSYEPYPPIMLKPHIDSRELKSQASLVQAKGLAKLEFARMESLDNLEEGTTTNHIIKVYKRANSHLGAVAKVSSSPEGGNNIMEKFFYQAAKAMGLEEYFVPTDDVKAVTQENFSYPTAKKARKITFLDETGNLVTRHYQSKNARRVAVQAALVRGQKLGANDKPGPYSSAGFLQALSLIIGFGMFDAHGNNIWVSDEKLLFFDMTQSMCHSNRPFGWGDDSNSDIRIPFRCGLFAFKEAYSEFSDSDREHLKNEAQEWKKRYDKFEAFLDLPATQKALTKLPPGWWHQELALRAFRERISAFEAAANDPSIKNMRDFAFACYPELRFFALCQMAILHAKFPWIETASDADLVSIMTQVGGLYRLGHDFVPEMLQQCTSLGYNVEMLHKWASNPNLTFEACLCKIALAPLLQSAKMDAAKDFAGGLVKSYVKDIVYDFKDVELWSFRELLIKEIQKRLLPGCCQYIKNGEYAHGVNIHPVSGSVHHTVVWIKRDESYYFYRIDFSEAVRGQLFVISRDGSERMPLETLISMAQDDLFKI